MSDVRPVLAQALAARRGRLLELARGLAESGEVDPQAVDWVEVEQILHGFEAVLQEALEGTGTAVREVLLETAVAAMAARGQTAAELAGSSTLFAVLLTEVLADLPAGQAAEGRMWLATFFSSYVADVVDATLAVQP